MGFDKDSFLTQQEINDLELFLKARKIQLDIVDLFTDNIDDRKVYIRKILDGLDYTKFIETDLRLVCVLLKSLGNQKITLPIWMRFNSDFSEIYFQYAIGVNNEYLTDNEVMDLFLYPDFLIYKKPHIFIALELFCNNGDLDFFEGILNYLLEESIFDGSKDYIIQILEDVKTQISDNSLTDKINKCLSKYGINFKYNDMINGVLEDINSFIANYGSEKSLNPNVINNRINSYLDALFEGLELSDVYRVFKLFLINFGYTNNPETSNQYYINGIYDYFLSQNNFSYLVEYSFEILDLDFFVMLRYKLKDGIFVFSEDMAGLWDKYKSNLEKILLENKEEIVVIFQNNIYFYLKFLALLYDLRLTNVIQSLIGEIKFKLSDIKNIISVNPKNQKTYIKFSKGYQISGEERISSSDFWILVPNYQAIRDCSELSVKFTKNDSFIDAYFFSIFFNNKSIDIHSADKYEYTILKGYNYGKTFAKGLETELDGIKVFCPFSLLPQDMKTFVYMLKKPTIEILKKYKIKLSPQRGRDDIYIFELK